MSDCKINFEIEEVEEIYFQVEEPENVSFETDNITEVPVTTPMYYTIDFDDSQTISAFYSKHIGNITVISTTNVSSYTVDGNSISLPYAISLNTTYLFEITKETAGQEAQLVITVEPYEYTETINDIDWTTGDGRYGYLLGDDTDVATNRTVLKFDNDLQVPGNWNSGWIVDPLINTLTLPALPTNTWWRFKIYVKDDKIIFVGGSTNASNDNNYFCYLDKTTDIITDLDGNLNQYTELSCSDRALATVPSGIFYDYVNNYLYVKNDSTGSNGLYRLDLNNNSYTILSNNLLQQNTIDNVRFRKTFFNPYKQCFLINNHEVYPEENKTGRVYNDYYLFSSLKIVFNRINKKTYGSRYRAYYNLKEYDEFSRFVALYSSSGDVEAQLATIATIDHNNNVIILFANGRYRYSVYRVDEINNKSYIFSQTTLGDETIDCMFAKDDIHLALSETRNIMYAIDTSDPANTLQADFGYYNLPVNCWALCTNRLL